MSKIYTIYKITNTVNQKCYIGFTSRKNPNRRYTEHKNAAFKGNCQFLLHKAFRKYGIDNFIFEIICQSKDRNYLHKEAESYFIKLYNSFYLNENSKGYNMTLGGDGAVGSKHSIESLNKRKNQIWSIESRNRVGNAHRGKIVSEETKRKMSESAKIRNKSPEYIKKLSDSKKKMYQDRKNLLSS